MLFFQAGLLKLPFLPPRPPLLPPALRAVQLLGLHLAWLQRKGRGSGIKTNVLLVSSSGKNNNHAFKQSGWLKWNLGIIHG